MPIIRKIQSRDVQSLADTFSHQEYAYFETLYLEHLQEERQTFVASEKDKEGERHYYGYISLSKESTYTQFWRRNIPEITDLYVLASHRKQGIGKLLISACEAFAHDSGHSKIGISVIQTNENKAIQVFYEKLGYRADGFGVTPDDNQLHLVKQLT